MTATDAPSGDPEDGGVDAQMRAEFADRAAVICAATPGEPVVYVSPAFERYTGYSAADMMGRNLAMLQGPDTESEAKRRFRELIDAREAGVVRITNYRKDGTPFVHVCEFRPIHTVTGEVTHFVAVQRVGGD